MIWFGLFGVGKQKRPLLVWFGIRRKKVKLSLNQTDIIYTYNFNFFIHKKLLILIDFVNIS